MKEIKLLHPFLNGSLGVYFPVGELKRNGTCENASKKCLDKCLSFKFFHSPLYVPEGTRRKIYEYFVENTVNKICQKILEEMGEAKVNILSWFVSGDCPGKIEKKVLKIMKELSFSFAQRCITKNKYLWENVELVKKDSFDLRIILSIDIDHRQEIIEYFELNPVSKLKVNLFAMSDYRNGRAAILKELNDVDFVISCPHCFGGYLKNRVSEINCNLCYKNKKGCFVFICDKYTEITKALMREIMYDAGAVDRLNPEKFPKKWIDKILPVVKLFFEKNENKFSNKDIEEMAVGVKEDKSKKFGKLEGYTELDNILNEYFNLGI